MISLRNLFVTIGVLVCAIVYRENFSNLYLSYFPNKIVTMRAGVYSQEKLEKFDGETYKNLYLAVLGTVFDVTEGKRHYEKGAQYNYFIGKDGSRSLLTGDFKDESPDKDHVIDFYCNELFTLLHWRNTFKQKYKKKGVLIGRYYDSNGDETAYMKELQIKLEQCEIEKENAKQEDLKYPPCNMAWTEKDGVRLWCTNLSGGVKRSWVGVPRQLYTPGIEKPKCICLNLDEKVTDTGLIKEYDNCPYRATTCEIIP